MTTKSSSTTGDGPADPPVDNSALDSIAKTISAELAGDNDNITLCLSRDDAQVLKRLLDDRNEVAAGLSQLEKLESKAKELKDRQGYARFGEYAGLFFNSFMSASLWDNPAPFKSLPQCNNLVLVLQGRLSEVPTELLLPSQQIDHRVKASLEKDPSLDPAQIRVDIVQENAKKWRRYLKTFVEGLPNSTRITLFAAEKVLEAYAKRNSLSHSEAGIAKRNRCLGALDKAIKCDLDAYPDFLPKELREAGIDVLPLLLMFRDTGLEKTYVPLTDSESDASTNPGLENLDGGGEQGLVVFSDSPDSISEAKAQSQSSGSQSSSSSKRSSDGSESEGSSKKMKISDDQD